MPRSKAKSNESDQSSLSEYKAKRSFDKTPEPGPKKKHSARGRLFVVQKHRATQLHYDFRLEVDGVLKSWAVPKGPSLNPSEKRLAMAVEDHPLDYAGFEGIIPEGQYGGGTVMVWDNGTYEPEPGFEDVAASIADGEFKFTLIGTKLKGSWVLVRTRSRQWLLIKHRDAFASDEQIAETAPRSVISDRLLAEIAKDEGGNVTKAATGDPDHKTKPAPKKRRASAVAKKKPPVALYRAARSSAQELELPAEAEPAPMPKAIQPMLATLVDEPFSSDDWIFETKWDGVRSLCYLRQGKHRIFSRRQNDVTNKYPELSHIGSVIAADQAVLDGEIVALDEHGKPQFQLLQPRFGLKPTPGQQRQDDKAIIVYYVFDLLYLNGYDLTRVDLSHRKELLKSIIRKDERIRFSDHVEGNGKGFFAQIEKQRLEGMIAKRSGSKYIKGRSREWLKVKTLQRSEVVIGGYTKPRGARSHFGALVVGLYDGDKLKFVGHTGGGFNRSSLKQLYDIMQPLRVDKSPFDTPVRTNEPVEWLKPQLVCEIKFAEWTADGIMRQPIFLGLREDKDPKECVIETKAHTAEVVQPKVKLSGTATTATSSIKASPKEPAATTLTGELRGDLTLKAPGGIVKLTNLDKVYWPEDGYTKGDLLKYYYQVAPIVLPYLKDRPLILKRYPNGIDRPSFHQHTVENPPDFVDTYVRESDGELVKYAICNNVAALLYIANLGAIALHPWSARKRAPEKPDWVLFDLDPGTAKFEQVLQVALILKDKLEEIGLACYPKTSGSKGLHVDVPIRNSYTHDQVVQFATLIAHIIAEQHADLVAVERMVSKRTKGRVYLDYLQNGFGKSLAGPYSVRARSHAMVSAPVKWEEVKRGRIRPEDFTIANMSKRIEKVGDLFGPALKHKQSLHQALAQIEAELKRRKRSA